MHTIRSISIVLVSGMAFGLGCQLIAGVNTDATIAEASSGGNGGMGGAAISSSSSSTGGGMGGMGGSPDCITVADCVGGECRNATGCDAKGACVWQYTSDGIKLTSQLYGDCTDRVCDGQGGIKLLATDKDPYVWSNVCYKKSCDAAPIPDDGVMCKTPWGNQMGTCNNLQCVDCMVDGDCGANKCVNNRCVPMTCTDLALSPSETDIDCGGPDCPACLATKICATNSDCEGSCNMATMRCIPPSCTDALRNGDETDIDCGGQCVIEMPPKKCLPIKNCLVPIDCESGVCQTGICQNSTCDDFIKNQGEQGIDCGGSCPTPCAPTP